MKLRSQTIGTLFIYGAALGMVALMGFASTNAGIDPRSGHHFDGFDPHYAPGFLLAFVLGNHAAAIYAVDADDDVHPGRTVPPRLMPRMPDSFTWFVQVPLHRILIVGPIWTACTLIFVLIGHTFPEYPGHPGTLWGDFLSTPLAAISFGLLCCAAANTCFAWSSIAEAFNRDHRTVYLAVLTFGFIMVAGSTAVFAMFSLPSLPTNRAFVLGVISLIVSTAVLIPLRWWAIRRVTRIDAADMQRAEEQQAHDQAPEPPNDALQPGERVITSFFGNQPSDHPDGAAAELQILVFTDRRVFRASITPPGRTSVIEQAQPCQLSGGTSEIHNNQVITTAIFNDRQPMSVAGGSSESSRRFAHSISILARTGRLPA